MAEPQEERSDAPENDHGIPPLEEKHPPYGEVSETKASRQPLVYFAYNYGDAPGWTAPLRDALRALGYLVFSPAVAVEQQFDPPEKPALISGETKLVSSLARLFKLPETLLLPIDNPNVVKGLRLGDLRQDVDSILFKDLYFLFKASVVVADLINEPFTPDLVQKLHYARLVDIPAVGVGPGGRPANAFMQKLVKVILTDDFNVANILPLIKAYS